MSRRSNRISNRTSGANRGASLSNVVGPLTLNKLKQAKNFTVAWSGFEDHERKEMKKMVSAIGAKVLDNAQSFDKSTVFISSTGVDFCRSIKTMAAFILTPNVVTIEWLNQSYNANEILPCQDYLMRNDEVVEKKFQCSMATMLNNGVLARASGGLLKGFDVIICYHGAGKGAWKPELDDVKFLVQAAKANLINQRSLGDRDASKVIIIVSDAKSDAEHSSIIKGGKLHDAVVAGAREVTWSELCDVFTQQDLEPIGIVKGVLTPHAIPKKHVQEKGVGKSSKKSSRVQTKTCNMYASNDSNQKMSHTPEPKTVKSPKKPPQYSMKKPHKPTKGKGSKQTELNETSAWAHQTISGSINKKQAGATLNKYGYDVSIIGTVDNDDIIDATQEQALPKHDPHQTPKKINATKMMIVHSASIRSCWREISNHNLPNPERAVYGSGTLIFYKHIPTGRMVANFVDTDGKKMIDAVIPLGEKAYMEVQGNNGSEPGFFWEACNQAHTSGGTTVKGAKDPSKATALRRFFFLLESDQDLTVALYFLFNKNMAIVREFFDKDGRFTHLENTLPPHKILKNEEEMDTDLFGMKQRTPAMAPNELEEAYGNDVTGYSQPLF